MGWPKGKPRGPRKPKVSTETPPGGKPGYDFYCPGCGKPVEPKTASLMMDNWHADCWSAEQQEAVTVSPEPTKPSGPYTVWVDYGYEGWKPRDFNSLTDAMEWDRDGMSRFVITKPVKYEVREVGPAVSERKLPSLEDDDDAFTGRVVDAGPPSDPSNPDSGKARYV